MKPKIAIIVLVLALLALAIALFAIKQQDTDVHNTDVKTIVNYSNKLDEAKGEITELVKVNTDLTNDLSATRIQLSTANEHIEQLSNSLMTAEVSLENTTALLAIARNQVTNLNVKVSDLEWHNKSLEQNQQELTNTIGQLNVKIADTERRLAKETKNRTFLEKELAKQIALRTDLEGKFNSIVEMRAQIRKLRDEKIVQDRLTAMKDPTVGKKGAELMLLQSAGQNPHTAAQPIAITKTAGTNAAAAAKPAATDYNLNVEVGSDGSVKVIAPLSTTNAPAK
jgi:predicted RNase H-like nuclease (RuvC/YqgF family)